MEENWLTDDCWDFEGGMYDFSCSLVEETLPSWQHYVAPDPRSPKPLFFEPNASEMPRLRLPPPPTVPAPALIVTATCRSLDDEEGATSSEWLTLPPSKSPILDAFVYCARNGAGAEWLNPTYSPASDAWTYSWDERLSVHVTDGESLLKNVEAVCARSKTAGSNAYRLKALQRWFDGVFTVNVLPNDVLWYVKFQKTVTIVEVVQRMTKESLRTKGREKGVRYLV